MNLSFDIISDLNLQEGDDLSWEGKATSMFCLIAGNISSDTKIINKFLINLSQHYSGVFYIDGALENSNLKDKNLVIHELSNICRSVNNTVFLHNNIVIFNGIAIVGINGWYGNHTEYTLSDNIDIENNRREDLHYLYTTIRKLQIHGDVKQIIVLSNSVPDRKLYFHEMDGFIDDMSPTIALKPDTERKVKYWVFGTYNKMVDTTIDGIRFISNSKRLETNYWAKRLQI